MEVSNQAPFDMEHGRENPYIPLATSMRGELDNMPALFSGCCIYRVPQRLRCRNAKAYTPQVVSIGPLHHGKKILKPMEMHKKRYLQDFLCRTKVSLEEYIVKIKDQETELRNCYAEPIGFNSDQFVKIILVDAAFIVELLVKFYISEINKGDRKFDKPWMIKDIMADMLLLENQLPFFILEDLFGPDLINTVRRDCYTDEAETDQAEIETKTETQRHSIIDLFYGWIKRNFRRGCNDKSQTQTETEMDTDPSIERLSSIIDLSYEFFKEAVDFKWTKGNLEKIFSSDSKVEHFVDLIRTLYLPMKILQTSGPLKTLTAPSITELHQAGVKFKVRSSEHLLDIRFTDGILEIAKIIIDDDTELKLRNIIAFEQCHFEENYVNDYVCIVDDFVNTPKDVELLAAGRILENFVGDNRKVSTLINNLCVGVGWDHENYYFANVYEDLNKYCKKRRHKWKANLRQKYFNTPWAIISFIAAVLLLILTFIQTVCSIISLKNQH